MTILAQKRKNQVLSRKNFMPSLIVLIFLWISLFAIVYFTDPFSFGILPLFFILVFSTLTFTFSLLLASTRRGIVIAAVLTVFLVLRYFGIGNIINFILLASLGATFELYFSRK